MSKFKKKAIELAKKIAKELAGWVCEKCGRLWNGKMPIKENMEELNRA